MSWMVGIIGYYLPNFFHIVCIYSNAIHGMGILKLTAVSVFACCVCSNGCIGVVKTLMNAPIYMITITVNEPDVQGMSVD